MLTVINRYCHGYVAVPVIVACVKKGLFDRINERPSSFQELADEFCANSGNLAVALLLLESMGWISRTPSGSYFPTIDKSCYSAFTSDILELYEFQFEAYLSKSSQLFSLRKWINYSQEYRSLSDENFVYYLDGLLMVPLLLELRKLGLFDPSKNQILFQEINEQARYEIIDLFIDKGLCELKNGHACLTNIGIFLLNRSLNMGFVASYSPMLKKMPELLFGDSELVFELDSDGHEIHLDRTLNVISSGFQHEKYFRDVDQIIQSVFDQKPIEEQPKYIADIGCGDGTLLKRVYDVIREKTERGKVLDKYPLTLVGVDYNQKALDATSKTLGSVNFFTLHGDIGNPKKIENDLRKRVDDVENVLYIRSFLDHDRPFIKPKNSSRIDAIEYYPFDTVTVDNRGQLIKSHIAHQSLVEHMQRWGSINSKFGIIILEVHSLDAKTVFQNLNECENLHFDSLHAFSRQNLTSASLFQISAAEAGLMPDYQFSERHPSFLPFTRITVNYFRKWPCSIRHICFQDLDALLTLENNLSASQQSSKEEILERLNDYPQGQLLLEQDGILKVALYSQRLEGTIVIHESDKLSKWNHNSEGSVSEIIHIAYSDLSSKNNISDLIDFFNNYCLQLSGVDNVEGALHFKKQLMENYDVLESNFDDNLNIYSFVNSFEITKADDTEKAEFELEEFAARCVLGKFQGLGTFLKSDETYESIEIVRKKLGIIPKYQRWFNALIDVFLKFEFISLNVSGEITVEQRVDCYSIQNIHQEKEAFQKQFELNHPHVKAFQKLLFSCLDHYLDILQGKVEVNEIIFADGSMDLFAGIFTGNRVSEYYNKLLAEIIYRVISKKREIKTQAIFILELGSGTGGNSEAVLEKLCDIKQEVIFYYTDISSTFTRYGESRFSEKYPFIKFKRLNIELDPIPQGFEKNSFDIIFAANVLHDTTNIESTLKQVKRLLKPQGLLILNEYTKKRDLLLFTGGLLHGYWLYNDPEGRLSKTCLLSSNLWRNKLEKSGFSNFNAYGLPFIKDSNEWSQSVMFCTYDAEISEIDSKELGNANNLLSIKGLESDIKAILVKLIGKRMFQYTSATPFMELGLDSMEILEFRKLISKKLGKKLDAPFLFQHNTVEKVCNYFKYHIDSSSQSDESRALENHKPILENILRKMIGEKRIKSYSPTTPLMELGLDSMEILEFRKLISKHTKTKLEAPFLFQNNTIEKINAYFQSSTLIDSIDNQKNSSGNTVADSRQYDGKLSSCDSETIESVKDKDKEKKKKSDNLIDSDIKNIGNRDVAIVGISLRFPGDINSPEDFWDMLKEGRSAVGQIPVDRIVVPKRDGKEYLQEGGYLSGIDAFDAPLFRMSRREVELMDPQQRILLELCWELAENSGYKPSALSGSDTGVYIGACHFDYTNLLVQNNLSSNAHYSSGTSGSILPNRLSYFYNLQGPSMLLDTACSSSLVAVHEAVRAIRDGTCSKAIVGGVNLICSAENTLSYDDAGMLSKDAQCYTFDARANGYVRGEGAGLVLLKDLQTAIEDNDHIYSLIKGSAINHGGQASSLTAPNPEIQSKLIIKAMHDAGVDPKSIGYIEAHGSGTALGDPIECEGLKQAFQDTSQGKNKNPYCGLGSVKTNIGHLEAASGIAGLI